MTHEPLGLASLLGAVLVASLVGSLHCAGMCGALVLFAVSGDADPARARTPRTPLHLAYHIGRAAGYSFLGAIAGAVGAAVDVSASLAGAQRPAAITAGALMIALGALALGKAAGLRGLRVHLPANAQRIIEALHRAAFAMPPTARAAAVGLLTPLLPCGWLYAFAIIAAGTASPALGAATMLAFWLGTLPVLGGVGLGLQAITGPLRARLPQVTAVIVIALGLFTALGRVGLPTAVPSRIDDGTLSDQLAAVRAAGHDALPCCNPDPAPPIAAMP